MALTLKRLTDTTTLASASAAAVFTNPTGKKSYVKDIILHNSNSTIEAIKLYRVPDSAGSVGTADDNSNKFWQKSMDGYATAFIELPGQGMVLEDVNDTIQGITTTSSKVTISIDGGQE